jgi:putative DNA primase/helicase
VLGGIQPGPFAQYVREADTTGSGADGLLQRIQMLVYPDEPSSWTNIDRYPNTQAKNDTFECFQHLANLDPRGIQADMRGSIPFLRFSEAAQEIFTEWRTLLETVKLRADEQEVIESHLSKYRSLVPSLALICHLVDGGNGPVSDVATRQAVAWAGYLEAHARRIYSMALDDNAALCALAARIQSGGVTDGFTARDAYKKHWKHLDKNSTRRAIDALEILGWLRVEEIKTRGRPTTRCWINPKVEVS